MQRYSSRSTFPPVIVVLGNKTWITPDWQEVPHGTTISQVSWNKPKSVPQVKVETRTVTGSKGNSYVITRGPSGKWSCTCPGYGFRKFCKHTQGV